MPPFSKLTGVAGNHAQKPGLRYKLECYICGPSCIQPSPFEGWATFSQIFQRRPDGCRFAIAQAVPLYREPSSDPSTPLIRTGSQPVGDYLCWDLLTDDLVLGRNMLQRGWLGTPVPLWQSPSLDGLIMKAMALYDREH